MKPDYKPLKELTPKAKKNKTKVKVLHKGYPQQSPNKSSRYQRLVFEDDEGFAMKGTLFNNDIEKYAEALQRKAEYEVDDATVNLVPKDFASRPGECSMIINDRVKINPLTIDPSVVAPEYQPLATIPRSTFDNNLYDAKDIKRESGRIDVVREVHIIDQSSDRPVFVSLWNEIIDVHEPILNAWQDSFTTAGLLALNSRSYKGFILSSTMSTTIIVRPEGAKADALRDWAVKNKDVLIDHRSKLAELHSPSKAEVITQIESLNKRKAHNTWQEELFTIKATLPAASFEQMYLYVGCSKCSRKCDVEAGHQFVCENCCATDAVGQPRAVFKVDFTDATGTIQLPLFVKHVEFLLGLSALQLWNYSKNGDTDVITEKMHILRQRKLIVKIGPTLGLTTSRVLSWAVRDISFDESHIEAAEPSNATDSQEHQKAILTETETPTTEADLRAGAASNVSYLREGQAVDTLLSMARENSASTSD